MTPDERLDLADLSLSTEFSKPREHADGVAMRFLPPQLGTWNPNALWPRLPPHPNILQALGYDEDGYLLVRYAAIDWKHEPLPIDDAGALSCAATWGIQLADALAVVVSSVRAEQRFSLSRVEPYVDIDDSVRIGFLPIPAEGEPEACEERTFIGLVGKLLSRLVVLGDTREAQRLSAIIERSDRFPSFVEIRKAFVDLGGRAIVRDRVCWDHIELGLGFLAIAQTEEAICYFEQALAIDPSAWAAFAGLKRAAPFTGGVTILVRSELQNPAPPKARQSWERSEVEGATLEAARNYAGALDVYRRTRNDRAWDAKLFVATARCYLQLGDWRNASDFAERALAVEAANREALGLIVNACLLGKQHEKALKFADRWVTIEGAAAHYARGKALLALKRLSEARDAFDRALAADPRLVPAMLLRREADRQLKSVRDATGVQRPIEIDVPVHLPELRPLFVAGRIEEAITVLAGDAYAEDAPAQLVRASCLEFAGRFAEAAEIYERIASRDPEHRHAALLGRAHMLSELGEPDLALELFDALRAERPDDLDVIEGRAWVLDRLGRSEDAKVEFRRYVALNQGRSDRRVRTTLRR